MTRYKGERPRRTCPNCGAKVAETDKARYYEGPMGYVQWHEWAEKMGKTHTQLQCPKCQRLTMWQKKD